MRLGYVDKLNKKNWNGNVIVTIESFRNGVDIFISN